MLTWNQKRRRKCYRFSDYMHMTRGAISKITKCLIKAKCITPYLEPENKKEIYFRLTPQEKVSMRSVIKDMNCEKKRYYIFKRIFS